MNLIRHLLFIAVAIILAGCAQSPPAAHVDDDRGLAAQQAEYYAAHAARDLDRVAALFSDDAVLQIANMPAVEGRDSIREFFGSVFRFLADSSHTPQRTEIAVGADMAFSVGATVNAFAGPDGVQEFPGKYAIVWQRRDGRWQIVVYSVSSDTR